MIVFCGVLPNLDPELEGFLRWRGLPAGTVSTCHTKAVLYAEYALVAECNCIPTAWLADDSTFWCREPKSIE